jgi:transposase|tara:strand:+ start:106 stop:1539 length:1434 start_codon:yes stop_codon:yes gene_type:complete
MTETSIEKGIKRNFSEEEWEATPESVKDDFINLERYVLKLFERKKQLEERIDELEVKAKKNSRNSSKPPSSDNPFDRPPRDNDKKPKGKSGAKAGHPGHRQKLMKPTETVSILPQECECGNKEFDEIKPFYTHQEIELPKIKMEVTHFILHQGQCSSCAKTIKTTIYPQHRSGYGPRLSALIGETSGIEGNSRSTVKEFCSSVLDFHISLGAIGKVIYRVSEAIKPHYEAIAKVARKSEVNGIDETSWFKNGTLMWLWAMVNSRVAFFMIHKRRSKEAFLALIGDWKGILISDGYGVYQKWINLRQTCLAHLIRIATDLSERLNPDIQSFGEKALLLLQSLCNMAKVKPSEEQWNDFYAKLIDLIFDNHHRKDDAGKLARRLLKELDSLWVFLEVAGVEPTNNNTERGLRFAVLWRKRSQGTRADKGDRWVERILSLKQTARLRGISSFNILTDAMNCYFKEQQPDLSWIYLNNPKS